MNPEIQIYVPSCNYGRYLDQALDSIVSQSFQRWHCYIIDEKSSDETSKVAQQFVNKHGSDKFEYGENCIIKSRSLNYQITHVLLSRSNKQNL